MKSDIDMNTLDIVKKVEKKLKDRPEVLSIFNNCFKNTLETTLNYESTDSVFIVTGDIPAMWLRDSTAQMRPYLLLADEKPGIADLIKGVVNRQFFNIIKDPYANAFNEEDNGKGHQDDITEMTGWLWERKYEIDSLCYPIQLAYLYWKVTGDTGIFNDNFKDGVEEILKLWVLEQDHSENSTYTFTRKDCPPTDTLSHDGKGAPVAKTGMTWSGFRPSDDACIYGYLIPSNMFAVVVLNYLSEIYTEVLDDQEIVKKAKCLAGDIKKGIEEYGIIDHPTYGKMYAYETDGYGNYNLMDDANVPSLLSMPYLGYCAIDDPIYINTRSFILSEDNPYYYKGKVAAGIGSPHTPEEYIWHIALAMQGLTANDSDEKEKILNYLVSTDADTSLMHEGFHCDDPSQFTRPWFSWANSMFVEFVLDYCAMGVEGTPLYNN